MSDKISLIPGKLYKTYKNRILVIFSIIFNKNRNLYEALYTLDGKLNHFAFSQETLECIQNKIEEIV